MSTESSEKPEVWLDTGVRPPRGKMNNVIRCIRCWAWLYWTDASPGDEIRHTRVEPMDEDVPMPDPRFGPRRCPHCRGRVHLFVTRAVGEKPEASLHS